MDSPDKPSVPLSEPEKEEQFYQQVKSELHDSSRPLLININAIKGFLSQCSLSIDEDGFIVDSESGEFVEPYNFSQSKFEDSESPADDPLKSYLAPESECDDIIMDREKAHITDLHTIQRIGNSFYPIRDESMALRQMAHAVGVTFRIVFKWSNCVSLVTDSAEMVIEYNLPDEEQQELKCLACEYTAAATEWTQEGDTVKCPNCTADWTMNSLEVCTACQHVFPFSEMTDEESSMYWEPHCPECNADHTKLHSQDRYTTFEEAEQLKDVSDLKHENIIKQFD